MQLLAVACMSLAAKLEETEVPLSLDLQVNKIIISTPLSLERARVFVYDMISLIIEFDITGGWIKICV